MGEVSSTYEVHGDIDTSVYVDTILECSRYCHQRKTCDYIVYNDTTGICKTIEHSGNLMQRHGNELFFRKEKGMTFNSILHSIFWGNVFSVYSLLIFVLPFMDSIDGRIIILPYLDKSKSRPLMK